MLIRKQGVVEIGPLPWASSIYTIIIIIVELFKIALGHFST